MFADLCQFFVESRGGSRLFPKTKHLGGAGLGRKLPTFAGNRRNRLKIADWRLSPLVFPLKRGPTQVTLRESLSQWYCVRGQVGLQELQIALLMGEGMNNDAAKELLCRKNPHAHNNKIATSTPLLKRPRTPPLKGGILWAWGLSSRKNQKMPGAHKIGAAISGPRITGGNFMDTTLFLTMAQWVALPSTIVWRCPVMSLMDVRASRAVVSVRLSSGMEMIMEKSS